jgi:hypothetical protein
MTGSAKPIIFPAGRMMGFAALYPSYAAFHPLTVSAAEATKDERPGCLPRGRVMLRGSLREHLSMTG